MNAHSHLDRGTLPILMLKLYLRIECGAQCITGRVERRGKRIPDNLKNISILGFDSPLQDLTMPREQRRQHVRKSLREYGTAFDICKKKGNSSTRLRCHKSSFRFRHYDINNLFWKQVVTGLAKRTVG